MTLASSLKLSNSLDITALLWVRVAIPADCIYRVVQLAALAANPLRHILEIFSSAVLTVKGVSPVAPFPATGAVFGIIFFHHGLLQSLNRQHVAIATRAEVVQSVISCPSNKIIFSYPCFADRTPRIPPVIPPVIYAIFAGLTHTYPLSKNSLEWLVTLWAFVRCVIRVARRIEICSHSCSLFFDSFKHVLQKPKVSPSFGGSTLVLISTCMEPLPHNVL